ncbi:Mak10-domain-containing protein [Aaosphaeria arxii CBS 175.79]|uniref:Mak10-domain-containing protein n=1 Tax=Aaosphaeria arxii CBS 175.79 TaxID=1450172 RepID=A0A6A5XTR1_9PLEO|nr:Mak10-domain-containing protein [Aaosphaeria arxii CBS 175.79]KAF2016745.1 Mak10-domain-containing protein [Aaosphaeria arxii CBS 175.79]
MQQSTRPPEPKVHDITEKFTRACNALEVGQLVKDDLFTLFESIGALEIMDSKMDSGFLKPGETLEHDYDALNSILPEELVGIMDQLLCHEMAWHTGYPLSQTLFTSVYIDNLLWPEPKTLAQAQFYRGSIPDERRPGVLLEALRAYCLAVIKCCDYVIAKVTGRDYFEEEDFCTHTYNRVLFVQIPLDVFMRELDAAIENIESEPDLSEDVRSAIITRLQFRKDFLIALDPDCPLSQLESYWPPIRSNLQPIKDTQPLGKPVPSSFTTKIQRRLASTVPPRPIVEFEFKDAFEKLQQICTDCEQATNFVDLPSDPIEFQSFLWAYAGRKPAPLTYARSYLGTILFHPETLNTGMSLPLLDVKGLVYPLSPVTDQSNWALSPPRNPLMPKSPRLQLSLLVDEFIERASQPYLDFWTALGQNRCRLRRMMTHVIIGWDNLQADAGIVDEDINRVVDEMGIREQVLHDALTTWTYHKKLWMVERIVLLGFEQDIYLPDEYASMYNFLSIIASRRALVLSRISEHHAQRIASGIIDTSDPENVEYASHIESLQCEATALQDLSAAMAKLYTVLLYLRLVPVPKRPFSTEELRYELRMKPFLALQPPEVEPFAQHQALLQPFGPYERPNAAFAASMLDPKSGLWTDMEAALQNAKGRLQGMKKQGAAGAKASGAETAWKEEFKGLVESAVLFGVVIARLKGAVRKVEGSESGVAVDVKVEIPAIVVGTKCSDRWIVPTVSQKLK